MNQTSLALHVNEKSGANIGEKLKNIKHKKYTKKNVEKTINSFPRH